MVLGLLKALAASPARAYQPAPAYQSTPRYVVLAHRQFLNVVLRPNGRADRSFRMSVLSA